MADYNRRSNKFLIRGMNMMFPPDRLTLEWAQDLVNVRIDRLGEIRQRPGLEIVASLPVGAFDHSILWMVRTLDFEALPGSFRRFAGVAGGRIFVDDITHALYTQIDTGYDGNGYTEITARPDRSPIPYYFVANGARQSKFDAIGTRTEWGLAAPTLPMIVELSRPVYRIVDDCNSNTGFVAAGGATLAGAPVARISAVAISNILYDTGTTGWACVNPASMDENWQPGIFVTTSASVETVLIVEIHPNISTTTIAAIAYDSGTTGMCTITLTLPTEGLERNTMLRIAGAENVRVISVTLGLDGIPSFRCSTTATRSAGDAVAGLKSFRAYFVNTHAAAETLSASYVQISTAAAQPLATLTKAGALDLSSTNVGATRPVQGEDFLHISFIVSDFAAITEIQLQFDCDAATNTFSQNYFYLAIRQPDLTNVIAQNVAALTAQQQELQRQELDSYRQNQVNTFQRERQAQINTLLEEKSRLIVELVRDTKSEVRKQQILKRLAEIDAIIVGEPFVIDQGIGPISVAGASGSSQWSEIKVPISQFQRVGTDETRGWKDIASFRITLNCSAAVTIGIDDIWVGGTYGPDSSGVNRGYQYIYVARNSQTGSQSNPSPPTRSPILAERAGIAGTITSYSDSQADVFDIYRIGGTLGTYQYVLTVDASPATFTDELPDSTVLTQQQAVFDRFKPWPIPDTPKLGTVNVVGTRINWNGGDQFNTAWARGSQIIINDRTYTLYSNPASATTLEINESAGTATAVDYHVPEGLLTGRPLPVVFGPYKGGGSGEFFFACGDPTNPGYLYFTNGNDPESASDANIIELCPPDETLVAGGVLDGIVYTFSDRRSWRILPSFNSGASGAGSLFYDQETSMGKGLAGRYAICFGDRIYWVSYDGIYASRGDSIESLTDESMAPLFRRDGSNYEQVSIFLAPVSFSAADEPWHQLVYSRDGLYYSYVGTDGFHYSLYYSFLTRGWFADQYLDRITHTLREAGDNVDTLIRASDAGNIFLQSNTAFTDRGTGFNCVINTRQEDWDDSRSEKQIGDQMIDINPAGQTVGAILIDTNGSTLATLTNITGATRARFVRDVTSGVGIFARSIGLQLGWTTVNAMTRVYEWQPAALLKPERIQRRVTDWDDAGYVGPKWLQGMRLRADTLNVAKDIQVQYDEAAVASNLTVTHNGEVTKEYAWTPVVAHQMRILGTDDDQWRNFGVEWIFEPEPGMQTRWHIQFSSLDQMGYLHIRDMLIAHRSTADISLVWVIDTTTLPALTIPHGSGNRRKSYLPMPAIKGKYYQAILTSAAVFGLYIKDLEVRCGSWGRAESYINKRPFGDLSRESGDGGGARI